MPEQSTYNRRHFLRASAMGVTAAGLGVFGDLGKLMARTEFQLSLEGELPSLGGATGWLNSQALTTAGLRGRVVLVDFWTYTCINWRRTLSYVRAWGQKYGDHGFVVIGVHTPEFGFEHNINNVRVAAKEMSIDYPIALDNDYAIWRAFKNQYWPALYFVDAKGHIRHHQFGEGQYEQSERVIQQLLGEAKMGGISHELVSVNARGAEEAADWDNLNSAENYVGYERTENFASSGGVVWDEPHIYAAPEQMALNHTASGRGSSPIFSCWNVLTNVACCPRHKKPKGRRFRECYNQAMISKTTEKILW